MMRVLQSLLLGVQQVASESSSTAEGLLGRIAEVLGLEFAGVVQKGVKAVIVLFLAWVSLRLVRALTRRILARIEGGEIGTHREQRTRTLVQLLNSVGTVVIALAALLTILNLYIDIGPLLAGVGVMGLAVSFGAQSLVKDVISGFFILFENQYDIGDVVEINGVAGVVERMTLRVVAVRDLSGVLHIIPNGGITIVSNKTSEWSRAVLDIGVAYKEDVDHVIRVLNNISAAIWEDSAWRPKLGGQPEVLGVDQLADSAVVVRLIVKTRPGKQWGVRRELLRRVKNRFDQEGIEIPFPQRTVHMRQPAGG